MKPLEIISRIVEGLGKIKGSSLPWLLPVSIASTQGTSLSTPLCAPATPDSLGSWNAQYIVLLAQDFCFAILTACFPSLPHFLWCSQYQLSNVFHYYTLNDHHPCWNISSIIPVYVTSYPPADVWHPAQCLAESTHSESICWIRGFSHQGFL